MVTLNIKPISVNSCWQGRRFSTPLYKEFQLHMARILPNIKLGLPPYKVCIEFGLSSKLADLDNGVKPLLDCMVKKYDFDDRDIYELNLRKVIVSKGEEYIRFKIENLTK